MSVFHHILTSFNNINLKTQKHKKINTRFSHDDMMRNFIAHILLGLMYYMAYKSGYVLLIIYQIVTRWPKRN